MVRDLQGYKKKQVKKVRSLGNMKEIKEKNVARGRIEGAKGLRAMKPSFIHTASSIYQCIYSIR